MSSFYFRSAAAQVDFEKTEQWDALLELTHAVWRVADVTIDNEMLKERLKRGAMDILTAYPAAVSGQQAASDVMDQIRSQCALLSLAQKTVYGSRQMNFVILKNEYYKISAALPQTAPEQRASHLSKYAPRRDEAEDRQKEEQRRVASHEQTMETQPAHIPKQEAPAASAPAARKPVAVHMLNDRQKKIMQFFNKRKGENVRLKEIAQFFPDLTDRTVRNDLRDLCMRKMISRTEGHGQASFYRLAKNGIDTGGEEAGE